MQYAKLICISGDANANKFYSMQDNGNGTFTATYGRVGPYIPQVRTYPTRDWDKKYAEKVNPRKGYKDVTRLAATVVDGVDFAAIGDEWAAALVAQLQAYSKRSVAKNYTVTAGEVTQAQIDEADRLLAELAGEAGLPAPDIQRVNRLLIELYTAVPRQMGNVRDELITTGGDTGFPADNLPKRIGYEQDTLDVMRSQVSIANKVQANTDEAKTLLDALGLDIRIATHDETATIRKMMGPNARQLRRAYAVTNAAARARYDAHRTQADNDYEELFWHGSRNENWLSILETSLTVRPTNAVISGKMYGYGIYGSSVFQKSLGYTSLRGTYWAQGNAPTAFLAVFRFHMGNILTTSQWESGLSSLTYHRLRSRGNYNSVHAPAGVSLRNPESIVYQDEQVDIQYLIEVGV